jgi:hypothetical protein
VVKSGFNASADVALTAVSLAGSLAPASPRINNPIPGAFVRVLPTSALPPGASPATPGRPGAVDVLVSAAEDVRGRGAAGIAQRLAIPPDSEYSEYFVIEFPSTSVVGVGSPINRPDPGCVGRGLTAGGAREFVTPDGPLPNGAVVRIVR